MDTARQHAADFGGRACFVMRCFLPAATMSEASASRKEDRPMPAIKSSRHADDRSPRSTGRRARATGKVAAIFADIKQTKNIDFVPAFWRTLATNPVQLEVVWTSLKTLMHPEAAGRDRGSIPRPARSSRWRSRPPTAARTASTRTPPPCASRASTRKRSARSWPSSGCST